VNPRHPRSINQYTDMKTSLNPRRRELNNVSQLETDFPEQFQDLFHRARESFAI